MKKSLFIFSTSLLVLSILAPSNAVAANAEGEATTADKLNALITDYIGDGAYTKKTTIALNDASINEMSACFHCNLTARNRTTYYRANQLLLAAEDGTIPAGSGSYVYDNGEVKRASAGVDFDGGTVDALWENVTNPVSCGQTEAARLEDYYVTLNTFTQEDYFLNWGLDDSSGTYYYDLGEKEMGKDENGAVQCAVWSDFLNFCAPMLYANSGNYLTPKSLTIKERYDAFGAKYLALSMYLADGEREGKLVGGYDYLAQARIYKGNNMFVEDLSTGYFLDIGGDKTNRLVVDPENSKQLFIKNVALEKGDKVKIWSTDRNYHGVSQGFEHNLSVAISTNTNLVDDKDNYIACETANYDFYVKLNDDGSYKDTYVYDQAARTIYCEANWDDIDSGKMYAHYWGDDVIGSEWNYKPKMSYDHKTGSEKDATKVVIPGATTNIKFCYNKTGGEWVEAENQTLGTDNSYYFDNWNNGSPKMVTYNYVPSK